MSLYTSVRESIRKGMAITNQEEAQSLRATLSSYVEMIKSVKEAKYLRGLDSGEKLGPREKVEQTAKRVGFVIPKVFVILL
jgi:hypothetical protein